MAYCYFQGEFVREEEKGIALNAIGLQRGFGIFDFFRSRNGIPTFLEDYLDRFDRSQEFMNLSNKIHKEEIRNAVNELLRLNRISESSFKLMLLGDGSDFDDQLLPLFYIINRPVALTELDSGKLITHEYLREYPSVKSINYFTSYRLHQRKKEMDAVDVLYHKAGWVTESSRSNVFIVKDGVLKTPENNVLHGINRKQILQLDSHRLDVKVEDFKLDELMNAEEVFISSTLKEIMPITHVDGKAIGTGKIGLETKFIQDNYSQYIADFASHLV